MRARVRACTCTFVHVYVRAHVCECKCVEEGVCAYMFACVSGNRMVYVCTCVRM